jgi:hypothetical protein
MSSIKSKHRCSASVSGGGDFGNGGGSCCKARGRGGRDGGRGGGRDFGSGGLQERNALVYSKSAADGIR